MRVEGCRDLLIRKQLNDATCDGMGGVGSWSSCSAARTAVAAAPGTPSTRASGSRRASARTRARCRRGCIRLGARGSSSATGTLRRSADDGPVPALELRARRRAVPLPHRRVPHAPAAATNVSRPTAACSSLRGAPPCAAGGHACRRERARELSARTWC